MKSEPQIMSRDINLTQIDPDPDQPRKHFGEEEIEELADSMREVGQAVPVLVRPARPSLLKPAREERFILVHGERRFRAAQRLGWESIRAEVRDLEEADARWLSLVENVQRLELSAWEEAQAYRDLLAQGGTQEQLAKKIGKSQSYIAQKLRLFQLPPAALLPVVQGALTEGHARQLLRLRDMFDEDASDIVVLREQDMPHKERMKANDENELSLYDPVLPLAMSLSLNPFGNTFGAFGWYAPEYPPSVIESCHLLLESSEGNGGKVTPYEAAAFWWANFAVVNQHSVSELKKEMDAQQKFIQDSKQAA